MSGVGRRQVLATGAAFLAAPFVGRADAAEAASLDAIFKASGLAALTGFLLLDLDTGERLEAHQPDLARPPASVAKVVTTLYALASLGPDFRFQTRLLTAGPVGDGVVAGDLVLAGGGDPVLDTDDLAGLVAALRARGVTEVAGRLLVADGALPAVAEIDRDQPEDAAYNPPVSGMNLNFNRVFLGWEAGGKAMAFSAPGERSDAPVTSVRAELVEAGPPRVRIEGGVAVWSFARDGVRRRGSVWLPVHAPGAYAGEVLRSLAGDAGLALPAAEVVAVMPGGGVLALHESHPLERVLRDMLLYSTNLTAEAVGLRASQARGLAPDGLAASGAAMTGWARERFGLQRATLVNHSGLSGASRLTPVELVSVLRQAVSLGLPDLLKARPILDARRKPIESGGIDLRVKSGTMDFVSGLAGYLTGKRRLAFAILAADIAARDRISPEEREKPPGAAGWEARAKAQEQGLLRRWAALNAV